MCKIALTIIVTLLLVQNILSFITFDENKEYYFKIEYEAQVLFKPKIEIRGRMSNIDMTIRKAEDNLLLINFKNVSIDGYNTQADANGPFKIQVVNYEIEKIYSFDNKWNSNDIKFRIDVLEDFFKDYSNITRLLDNKNWKEKQHINLPLGACLANVSINLHNEEIKIVAESTKLYCTEVPKIIENYSVLSDASKSGIKMIFVRNNTTDIKEIEVFGDVEVFIDVQKTWLTAGKSTLSYEYLGFNEVTEKVPFEGGTLVYQKTKDI